MGPLRNAPTIGALLLAGLTLVLAQNQTCTIPPQQLLGNPSFESGSLNPWDARKLCTLDDCGDVSSPEIVQDNAPDGSYVFRKFFDDNTLWAASQNVSIDSLGQPHNVSFWFRYEATPETTVTSCGLNVRVDGTSPLQNVARFSQAPGADWYLAQATWTPKSTQHIFYLVYGCNYTTLYLDDVQLWAPEREHDDVNFFAYFFANDLSTADIFPDNDFLHHLHRFLDELLYLLDDFLHNIDIHIIEHVKLHVHIPQHNNLHNHHETHRAP
ncbi:hypothetical protein HFD88_008746 [Aspergillus terreus]|nr:hypothetical protein HFD88_008746 [Aspergillus terreus]